MADTREAHKRNLMILSTVFILYVATGTSTSDINQVSVYFFTVAISRPDVIIYFSWILFAWYWYRFWLSHRRNNAFGAAKENSLHMQEFLKRAALPAIKKAVGKDRKLQLEKAVPLKVDNAYLLRVHRVYEGDDKGGRVQVGDEAYDIHVSRLKWWYLYVRHSTTVALAFSPAFWDTKFPHYFATAAVAIGLYRWL